MGIYQQKLIKQKEVTPGLPGEQTTLWFVLAVTWYGLGDYLSTLALLQVGLPETNPLLLYISGVVPGIMFWIVFLVMKVGILSVLWVLSAGSGRPYLLMLITVLGFGVTVMNVFLVLEEVLL